MKIAFIMWWRMQDINKQEHNQNYQTDVSMGAPLFGTRRI